MTNVSGGSIQFEFQVTKNENIKMLLCKHEDEDKISHTFLLLYNNKQSDILIGNDIIVIFGIKGRM